MGVCSCTPVAILVTTHPNKRISAPITIVVTVIVFQVCHIDIKVSTVGAVGSSEKAVVRESPAKLSSERAVWNGMVSWAVDRTPMHRVSFKYLVSRTGHPRATCQKRSEDG